MSATPKKEVKKRTVKEPKMPATVYKVAPTVVRLGELGTSQTAYMERQKSAIVNPYDADNDEGGTHQRREFTLDEFHEKWVDYCNSLPRKMLADANRMKQMELKMEKCPAVEVFVPNSLMLKHMQQEKPTIEKALRASLCNDALSLVFSIAETTGKSIRGLSDEQLWAKLLQTNTSLLRLNDALNLRLVH